MKHFPKLALALTSFFLSTTAQAQQGMGVGNNNPLEMLHVSGAIKVGTDINNSNAAPTGGAGTIRFKAGEFQGWDGTSWIPLGGGADSDWTISGNNIYNANTGNVGVGTTTPTQKLDVLGKIQMVDGNQAVGYIPLSDANGTMTWTDPATITTSTIFELNGTTVRQNAANADPATSDFVFGSPQMDDDGDVTHDARMFFNKAEGAFRAGEVDATEWDAANVGELSAAFGKNNTASGKLSFALGRRAESSGLMSFAAGEDVIASGDYSVAMGSQSEATNFGSVAVGYRAYATGLGSVSLGRQTRSRSAHETTIGMFNTDYTPNSTLVYHPQDRLFTVGNGTDLGVNRSDALVILKNGNMGVGSSTPADKLHVEGNIRMVDGNQQAGYIPVSDANGTMTWTDPATITTSDDGDWVVSGSNQYSAVSGNVGIGTNTPSEKLDISADIEVNGLKLGRGNGNTTNTRFGSGAFGAGTPGSGNTAIGGGTLVNATGDQNTAVGKGALRFTTAGNFNTVMGGDAGQNISTGSDNVVVGRAALTSVNTGSQNTVVGKEAGRSGPNRSGNVYLGYQAGYSATGDNKLYIENSNSAAPLIYGEFDNDILGVNGSLGIGTQSPQDKLHVEGNIRMVDGNQQAGYIPVSDANGTMTWTDPTTITTADDGDWTVNGTDIHNSNTGNVGIGINAPTAKLEVVGNSKLQGDLTMGGAINVEDNNLRFKDVQNSNATLIVSGNDAVGGNTGLTVRAVANPAGYSIFTVLDQTSQTMMQVKDNGNMEVAGRLGVGTASPGAMAEVRGNQSGLGGIQVSNSADAAHTWLPYSNGSIYLTGDVDAGVGNLIFRSYGSSSYTEHMIVQASTGNVGVGISAPSSRFHVQDNFASASQYVATIENTGNGAYSNGLEIKAGQNTQSVNNRFISFVKPNGTEIGAVRQVTSASVDYNTTSDERLKTNIQPTSKGLNDLMEIEVKDYVYKEDMDKPQTGFIAQQVYEHYPNAVSVGGDDVKTDPWMMDYGKMSPLLVKAIQDQQEIIDMLLKRIEELEKNQR